MMNQEEEAQKAMELVRSLISRFNNVLLLVLDLNKKPNLSAFCQRQMEIWTTQRTKISLQVEAEKKKLGLPIHCPKREQEELNRLLKLAYYLKLSLKPEEITDFFSQVFAESRQAQEAQRQATQTACPK